MKARSCSLGSSTSVLVASLGAPSPEACSPAPGRRAQDELNLIRGSRSSSPRSLQPIERIVSWAGQYKSNDASKTIVER